MNHIKQFIREKGLYLFCVAMVFAATAAGILALRSIVNNVADLARVRKEALQQDSTWNESGAAVDKPATDVPKPTAVPDTTPQPTAQPTETPAPAATLPPATAAPQAASLWQSEPLQKFSGDQLVYNTTLGDWRTHNGADYAVQTGQRVTPAKSGTVDSVTQDVLWGYVVEVTDAQDITWRYCGLTDPAVQAGDRVTTASELGAAGSIPAETSGEAHLHLECKNGDAYLDPESLL